MNYKSTLAIGAIGLFLTSSIQAQVITNANDNAGNYSSWPQTANNGFGFSNWSYNNLTPNGGYAGQFSGSSGGIDSANNNAFGFYANGGASAEAHAIAPFSAGALTANQIFSAQMQNGSVADDGGKVGFNLQDSSGNNIFQFYFAGGGDDYSISVWTGIATSIAVDTGIGYTSRPLTLSYLQEDENAWSFSIYEGDTLAATLSSASTGDFLWSSDISQVNLFTLNGGSARTFGDNGDLYFNNLQIVTVPEPASVILLGLSGLGALLMVRRRK